MPKICERCKPFRPINFCVQCERDCIYKLNLNFLLDSLSYHGFTPNKLKIINYLSDVLESKGKRPFKKIYKIIKLALSFIDDDKRLHNLTGDNYTYQKFHSAIRRIYAEYEIYDQRLAQLDSDRI